jgi:hypothetical protein
MMMMAKSDAIGCKSQNFRSLGLKCCWSLAARQDNLHELVANCWGEKWLFRNWVHQLFSILPLWEQENCLICNNGQLGHALNVSKIV